jgi:hypothetical protein
LLQAESPGAALFGDRRAYADEGLREIFGTHGGFESPIALEDIEFDLSGSIAEAREDLLSTYFRVMLSADGLARLEQRTDEILHSFVRTDGIVPLRLTLRLAMVAKRPAGTLSDQR